MSPSASAPAGLGDCSGAATRRGRLVLSRGTGQRRNNLNALAHAGAGKSGASAPGAVIALRAGPAGGAAGAPEGRRAVGRHGMTRNVKRNFGAAAVGAIAALAGAPLSARAQLVTTINFANFNNVSSLTLNGAAAQTPGLPGEQMTLSVTPPAQASAGTAYYTAKQRVDQGFVTDFHFRIRDRQGAGSDGLTFIVQNASLTSVGDSGGAIGFGTNLAFTSLETGIRNSVAVVFDTWDNSHDWPTIPGANVITVQTSHLGFLHANTPSSVDSLGGVNVPSAFNDGTIHFVRIVYTPGLMQVFYDSTSSPRLQVPVNLSNTLSLTSGQNAWVGFTAATGAPQNVERHEILDWSFASGSVPAPGAAALLGLGALGAARRRRERRDR
jgi:MYXO-CTERM domain-containing protein